MIKSKHFRKDVIMARVIFLCVCLLLIFGAVTVVSKLTKPQDPDTQIASGDTQNSESESEPVSEPVSEPETDSEPESVSEPETDSEPEPEPQRYVVTTASSLKLRKEPSTTSATLTSVPKGTKLELVETLEGWYKVLYEGQECYISSRYAKLQE